MVVQYFKVCGGILGGWGFYVIPLKTIKPLFI